MYAHRQKIGKQNNRRL